MDKVALRALTKSLYDLQLLRIQAGNRVSGNFRVKLGQNPGEKMEDREAQKILHHVKAEYKRLTDGIVKLNRKTVAQLIVQSGVISDEVEFRLVQTYMALLEHEERGFKDLGSIVAEFPIWTKFLQDVKGIGPAMAAVIISEFDPYKARHASSFWRYAGLDTVQTGPFRERCLTCGEEWGIDVDTQDDFPKHGTAECHFCKSKDVIHFGLGPGHARSRKKEDLVTVKYINAKGEEAERLSVTFNPLLKTKLMGVLAASFLRSKNEKYYQIYVDYRNRLLNHEVHKEKTKLHQHNMALRYMMKIFVADLWEKWRLLEGLSAGDPYHLAKLRMQRHAA